MGCPRGTISSKSHQQMLLPGSRCDRLMTLGFSAAVELQDSFEDLVRIGSEIDLKILQRIVKIPVLAIPISTLICQTEIRLFSAINLEPH